MPSGIQFRIVDAFVDLVEEDVLAGPVALVLEDLHWRTPSTIVMLRSLARRLTYVPVVLLATCVPAARSRPLEAHQHLDAGRRTADNARPSPRGGGDTTRGGTRARRLGPSPLEELAGAAGNPLFIGELVKALGEADAIRVVDGRAEIHDVSFPPSLRLTILRRLSFLDDDVLDLLRVASALGSTFSLRDAATVLDRSATELLQPVREALLAGVLEEREARLAFRHDLIREAIDEVLPEDARAALHLEAGRRLARARAPALQVASSRLRRAAGRPRAVDWATRCGAMSSARPPAVAVELLERALDLVDAHDRRAGRLRPPRTRAALGRQTQEAEARAREGLARRLHAIWRQRSGSAGRAHSPPKGGPGT